MGREDEPARTAGILYTGCWLPELTGRMYADKTKGLGHENKYLAILK